MNDSRNRLSHIAFIVMIFVGGALAGLAIGVRFIPGATPDPVSDAPADDRPDNLRQLQQLADLPYLSGVAPASDRDRGVVEHDRGRAWQGVNFFNSSNRAGAYLLDMEGNRLVEWIPPDRGDAWAHAELLPDGDVLALVSEKYLMRVSADGTVRWRYTAPVHHDLWVTDEGKIYILARQIVKAQILHPKAPVFADEIHILEMDGTLVATISVLEALLRSPYAFLLPASQDLEVDESQANLVLDMLHANHVQVLDGSLEHLSPLFRRGHLLVSMRTINAIGILDPAEPRFVWMWGPTNIARQHHPTLLDTGRILIFDNGRNASQIVEFDVLSNSVVWRYAPIEGFYSEMRGSVQRLPNGNTLITESDPGVVFEVTPDGTSVWRFLSPITTADGLREPIWRMTRYDPNELPFLGQR